MVFSWPVTVAYHTWAVRLPWTRHALHSMSPRRAVPRKLLSNSIVVKRYAPSGRFANVPSPQEVPASATTVAACR